MNRASALLAILAAIAGGVLGAGGGSAAASEPESRQVSDPAREQGLSLGFADASGAFLGAVQVIIRDRAGVQVVDTVVDGPWFFAPLPAGSYTVTAIFDDRARHASNVRLSKDYVTVMIMYWDLNVPPTQMLAGAETKTISG